MPILAGKLEGAGTAGQLPAPKYTGTTAASASNHGGSGYIAAKVGGVASLFFVDNGATLSVIPQQVWIAITKGGSGWVRVGSWLDTREMFLLQMVGRWESLGSGTLCVSV